VYEIPYKIQCLPLISRLLKFKFIDATRDEEKADHEAASLTAHPQLSSENRGQSHSSVERYQEAFIPSYDAPGLDGLCHPARARQWCWWILWQGNRTHSLDAQGPSQKYFDALYLAFTI
jgi:hypothetical protein